MKKYKQSGRNNKYPEVIEVWRKGDTVPDWISDICKIKFIDGEGNKTLDYRETSTGGYELLSTTGEGVVIKTTRPGDYVCTGDEKIFVLTESQLELLYKQQK